MGSGSDGDVAVSGDVEVHLAHNKVDAPSSIHSVEMIEASAADYTQEESRLLVRKLDWHVGHCHLTKVGILPR